MAAAGRRSGYRSGREGAALRRRLLPLRFNSPRPPLRALGWFSRFDSPLTTFGDQAFFARRMSLRALAHEAEYRFSRPSPK
jgi:hypothetical protein